MDVEEIDLTDFKNDDQNEISQTFKT